MARKPKAQTTDTPAATKQAIVLELLRRPQGASLDEIVAATSWKEASTRGFLSAVVQKRLGFELGSDKPDGGERRYHLPALKTPE